MSDNLLKEIWQRRSLIILFAFNDVRLRYRNSALGFIWSFLEPLLMLTVLYVVFTNLFKSGIENYPLYLLLGLIIWYMFSRATTMGISSLVDKSGIIKKIYFKRQLIVISSCLTAFIMMGFEFIAFGVFTTAYKFVPPLTSLFLPLLLIELFVLALGISLLLSVVNVYFRDVQFIWQILLQAGFFISPIIYKLSMFPEKVQWLLQLNPLVSILDTAHDLVLYGKLPSTNSVIYMIVSTTIIFIVGSIAFSVKDKKIMDEL